MVKNVIYAIISLVIACSVILWDPTDLIDDNYLGDYKITKGNDNLNHFNDSVYFYQENKVFVAIPNNKIKSISKEDFKNVFYDNKYFDLKKENKFFDLFRILKANWLTSLMAFVMFSLIIRTIDLTVISRLELRFFPNLYYSISKIKKSALHSINKEMDSDAKKELKTRGKLGVEYVENGRKIITKELFNKNLEDDIVGLLNNSQHIISFSSLSAVNWYTPGLIDYLITLSQSRGEELTEAEKRVKIMQILSNYSTSSPGNTIKSCLRIFLYDEENECLKTVKKLHDELNILQIHIKKARLIEKLNHIINDETKSAIIAILEWELSSHKIPIDYIKYKLISIIYRRNWFKEKITEYYYNMLINLSNKTSIFLDYVLLLDTKESPGIEVNQVRHHNKVDKGDEITNKTINLTKILAKVIHDNYNELIYVNGTVSK